MNLLLFSLAVDADDPLLGFTTNWLNRLAAYYDRIDVIAMRAGRLALAPNVCVFSVGKEHGFSEARRAIEFYRLLFRLRRERSYAACFAHMMPLFAVMGAPLLSGVPITLWYTHRQAHRILQLAARVSRRVVTAAPDSFPLKTAKLRVVGHGIDTDFFSPIPLVDETKPPQFDVPYIVHVARLMPIKHQAALIRALPDVPGACAVFVGDVPPNIDPAYRAELEALARNLGVADRVRAWLRQASMAVNLSPAGLFDKAALESMAVAVPTLACSPAFDDVLGESCLRLPDPDDSAALAARLRGLLALPAGERRAIGDEQRQRVIAAHSLDGLIQRLVSVINTGEPA